VRRAERMCPAPGCAGHRRSPRRRKSPASAVAHLASRRCGVRRRLPRRLSLRPRSRENRPRSA
jgi:hypothetical protein